MPSHSFSGKSKEDLVVVASLSGLLSAEAASKMTKTALLAYLEAEEARAEQAKPTQAVIQADTPRPSPGRRKKADALAGITPMLVESIADAPVVSAKRAAPRAPRKTTTLAEPFSQSVQISIEPPVAPIESIGRSVESPVISQPDTVPFEAVSIKGLPASAAAGDRSTAKPGRKPRNASAVLKDESGSKNESVENAEPVQKLVASTAKKSAIKPKAAVAVPVDQAAELPLEKVESTPEPLASTPRRPGRKKAVVAAEPVAPAEPIVSTAATAEPAVPSIVAVVPAKSETTHVTLPPSDEVTASVRKGRGVGRPSSKIQAAAPAAPVVKPTARPHLGHRDRVAHLPGARTAAHHQLIPAHHTLTTPSNQPPEGSETYGQYVKQAEQAAEAAARQAALAPMKPAVRTSSQSQSFQEAPQRSASEVRPQARDEDMQSEEMEIQDSERGSTGEVESRSEQVVQGRIDSEHGKTRRPFVESGEMVAGVLEIMPDGYGFLRKENYLQGSHDIYVPPQYIRRFNLRPGDWVVGPGKTQRETDRYQALLYIKEVNGLHPDKMIRRPQFDKLTPIYPEERFIMETNRTELSTRIIDLVAPIGKGQRGMIVSPPKAGKTILLQKIANAISINNPEVKLIVLLIDERPEEVTDMQRSINGEVVFSTFDKTPENHVKVTELVLERAMRLVELGNDVVILLDSITRMGRAYNLTINPTGRTLSGGLDPGALYGPKRFFGAARNIEGGGSLTIVATALIDTGSRMDEVIFEEFKGTGNMEVYLDRKLSEKRIFPAIDLNRSGTRREELLLTTKELDAVWAIRKAFGQLDTSSVTEMIINLLMKTNNNQHFVSSINVSLNDKNIFEAMRGNRTGSQAQGQAQNGHGG